mmetsp:Transcript_18788/g.27722  ORF Transcript_18788/g.27722 Transcript_18788/m.27722 type:complete len:210 (-) Transcript_18788:707-1336(-)
MIFFRFSWSLAISASSLLTSKVFPSNSGSSKQCKITLDSSSLVMHPDNSSICSNRTPRTPPAFSSGMRPTGRTIAYGTPLFLISVSALYFQFKTPCGFSFTIGTSIFLCSSEMRLNLSEAAEEIITSAGLLLLYRPMYCKSRAKSPGWHFGFSSELYSKRDKMIPMLVIFGLSLTHGASYNTSLLFTAVKDSKGNFTSIHPSFTVSKLA